MLQRMLIQPSQADVRRYFCAVYAKRNADQAMDTMETLVAGWIGEHPEYHADLADVDAALGKMFSVEESKSNPFLHLSMHLSVSEQCSIDQPRGIRQAVELLTHRRNSLHDAHHEVMESLGDMVWQSQQSGRPPDGDAYVASIQRRATRD
jgi:Domain of unknown function (DUF1841)